MQKKYFLSCILALAFFSASAQLKPTLLQFGPKIGANINTLKISPNPAEIDNKLSLSYNLGLFGRLNYKKFSLQPELLYQTKGANFDSPTEKHTYRYLSVPVLVGYEVLKGVHLVAGPEFSYATNAGWQKEGITQYGPDVQNDVAITVGTRIDMLDNFSLFNLNLRYTYGLNDLSTSTVESNPVNYYNRTLELSLTYNFSNYYQWYKKYGDKSKVKGLLKKKKKK